MSLGNELKACIPGAPCEMVMGDDGERCKCKARQGGFKNPKLSCLWLSFGCTIDELAHALCNDRRMSLWIKGIVSNDSEVVTNVCIPQSMGNTTEEKGKGRAY